MPIPEPRGDEDEKAYVSRCMGDDSMLSEHPDQEQRAAVCFKTFRKDNSDEKIVRRFDATPLPKATLTPEGYLKAPATRLARVGVQEYYEGGRLQRELRLPEHVFDPAYLDTLDGKPVVHRHPGNATGRVNAESARHLSRGVVTRPRADGDFVVGDVIVHDKDTVKAVREQGDQEISLAYDVRLVPIPGGVYKKDGSPFDGTKADYLQIPFMYNHAALEPKGRANDGTSDRPVRLRLDASLNQVVDAVDGPPKERLVKIQINGREHDVPDAAVSDIQAVIASASTAVNTVATEKKRADAAEGQVSEEKKRADAAAIRAEAAEKLVKAHQEREAATQREALIDEASTVLRKDRSDVERMKDDEIRRAMLARLAPELKLDASTSDDEVRAMLKLARVRPNPGITMTQLVAQSGERKEVRADASDNPLALAYKARDERNQKAFEGKD